MSNGRETACCGMSYIWASEKINWRARFAAIHPKSAKASWNRTARNHP
jgi:hypothetical protein